MNPKSRLAVASLAVAILAAMPAQAGDVSYWNNQVSVDTTNRIASGALGVARGSADANQLITCGVAAYANSTGTWSNYMSCSARSAANAFVQCYSNDPKLIAAVSVLSGDGAVFFGWDASYRCTWIETDASSSFSPKR